MTSTAAYEPPKLVSIVNEKLVRPNPGPEALYPVHPSQYAVDEVWSSLIRKMERGIFTIERYDRSTGSIVARFGADFPSVYVDCGVSSRTFKNPEALQDLAYRYPVADGSNFLTTNDRGEPYEVERETSLKGTVNVQVAPEPGQDGVVRVFVNVHYLVDVKVRSVKATATLGLQALKGGAAPDVPGKEDLVFDLMTHKPFSNGTVQCVSNGAIEKAILNGV